MVCVLHQPRPRSPGFSEEEWTNRGTGQKQVDCGFSDAVEFFLVHKLHEGEHRDSTKGNQLHLYPHIVLTFCRPDLIYHPTCQLSILGYYIHTKNGSLFGKCIIYETRKSSGCTKPIHKQCSLSGMLRMSRR